MGKLSNSKNLTKAEKYSIEGMYSNGMSIKEISKSLSREESLVSKYTDTFKEDEKKPHESKGMSVMTEAISERVDRIRQSMPAKPKHSAIHNIN
tara:strand:+ start:2187 stop:2468 length:282 start_codon:yes stop_codon:yes gene_type:complete